MEHVSPSVEPALILDSVMAGKRITEAEALILAQHADLHDLGIAARTVRNRLNDLQRVSYVVDRNVNYTNICQINCSFCAFHVQPSSSNGYVLTKEELRRKVEETKSVGGTGLLIQGGVHPGLSWDFYLDLVRFLNHELGIWVHGFSPIEIRKMAELSGQSLRKTLEDLRDAGLGSLPGGGAEILVDRIRRKISPKKGDVAAWLEVMETAHEIGMMTTGTMMFGIGESFSDRIEHLRVLREQQDRAIQRGGIGRHTAFAAWPFQAGHTPWEGKILKPTDVEYLRTISIARIYLDNFHHIQSSWVTMGHKVGQLALHYGCDDMGSLMIEENVVSSAGTSYSVNRAEMDRMIRSADFDPWQRDNIYRPVLAEGH
jgi:cyclic dehypoxanthinyl futalosine synthase